MRGRHFEAIRHAVSGLVWALKTQNNYQIHLFLIGLSLVGGWMLRISYVEWIAIFITALLGIIIETVNTAIEKMGDAIDTNYNENIKISKDVSASAMLLYAIGALFVASIIFLPKFYNLVLKISAI